MDFDTLNVRKINLGPPGGEVVLSVDTRRRLVLSQSIAFHGGDPRATPSAVSLALPIRTRVTLAQMNAGLTLAPAVPGLGYRLSNIRVIAIGGALAATAAATGIAVYGTQGGSVVKLYEVALAAGTQSAVVVPGTANTSVLANGASFAKCDANTAITCKTVSAGAFDLITATHIDIELSVTLE